MLSTEILEHVARLGASLDQDKRLNRELSAAPEFIRAYCRTITWPRNGEFRAVGSGDIRFGSGNEEWDLTTVDLSGEVQKLPDDFEIPGADEIDIYAFGLVDGGSYVLCIDGNDCATGNPMVYLLDHEMEDEPEKICRFEQFLGMLVLNRA